MSAEVEELAEFLERVSRSRNGEFPEWDEYAEIIVSAGWRRSEFG